MLVLKTSSYRNSVHIAGSSMCAAGIGDYIGH
jgi:hypothetical protein